MVFDPNIFFRAAEMQRANKPDIFANFANAYMVAKEKNQPLAQDIEKAAEGAYIKKASGLPITPEEDALAMGWDRIQSTKMGYDPSSGQLYPRQQSIFDAIAPQSSGYSPRDVPPPSMPQMPISSASDDAALDALGSPFPKGFQNGAIDTQAASSDFNAVPLSPQQLAELMGGQGPYEAAAPEYTQDGPRAPAAPSLAMKTVIDLRAKAQMEPDRARRNKMQEQADDLETKIALEQQKTELTKTTSNEQKQKGREAVQGVLDSMRSGLSELKKMGAVNVSGASPETKGKETGLIRGLQNYGFATGVGQIGARALNTKAQTYRDRIASARTLLIPSLMEATGMSAQMLNSNVELQNFLASLGDPSMSYEATTEILDRLSGIYGTKQKQAPQKQSPRQIQTPAGTVTIKRID